MTKYRAQTFFAAAALFLSVLACILPGQNASQPAPTADTVLLATIVAETFSAAIQETANAALPLIESTPTLPPPAETPTPEVSASGSMLTKHDDGTTFFVDQRAQYEVTVPSGWLALRVNEQEYLEAWTLAEASDPAIQRSLTAIQNQDPDQSRLFALDTQDGHIQGGFVTNVNFFWSEQDEISLDNDADLKETAALLPNAIPGLEVLTTELSQTASGIPIGIITSTWRAATADAVEVTIFQKQVYIKVSAGTLVITLSTTDELKDTVTPAFDGMMETFAISN